MKVFKMLGESSRLLLEAVVVIVLANYLSLFHLSRVVKLGGRVSGLQEGGR